MNEWMDGWMDVSGKGKNEGDRDRVVIIAHIR
jgi:hypothetical protein